MLPLRLFRLSGTIVENEGLAMFRFTCSSFVIALTIVSSLYAGGCGTERYDANREKTAVEVPPAKAGGEGRVIAGEPADSIQSAKAIDRKIIYRADIELVVEDLDAVSKQLSELIKRHKAYISASQVSGQSGRQRTATWTVRVPVDGFDEFRQAILDLGIPEKNGLTSEDVTDEFFDLKKRIANAQEEEKRLLDHLKKSTKDLKDILAVEREIARVRSQIERMQGRIQLLQNLTSLTTVTITLVERKDYVPPQALSFGDKISKTFQNSVAAVANFGRGFGIFVVAITPWLPVIILISGGLWWLIRRSSRPRKERPTA